MASNVELKMRKANGLPYELPYKRWQLDQFFIGLFGALAVFGVLMKLWKEPFWGLVSPETGKLLFEIFMPIGFLGESIVFIIMGFMKGDAHVSIDTGNFDQYMEDEGGSGESVTVNLEMPDSLTELIEERASRQLDGRVAELTNLLVEDVEKTRGLLVETNDINDKIQNMTNSLTAFTENIVKAGSSIEELGNIDSRAITEHTETVSANLENTKAELSTLQEEMRKLSERFKRFNAADN